MNTTHLWDSQTYQLEKEAVLLARDTANVWSFQTFAKPATQLQRTGFSCEELCKDYPGDDSCLETCENESITDQGLPEMEEDFAEMNLEEMTCEDMCEEDKKCLGACNICKRNISNILSSEMIDCMNEHEEKQHHSDGEKQHDSDEEKQHQKQPKMDFDFGTM